MLEVAVTKRLSAFKIDAEFSCATNGIVALFGRSGAGKTSLVNMLAGLSRPDSGRIEIEGVTVFDSSRGLDLPPERRRIGYVFQEGRLFPHMTVRGNLTYGLRRAPADERRIQLDQIVDLLGLEALLGRRPHDLSGGEKQRVALGRALLTNPRLLLMDEPLAGLDQARKDEVLLFIERLRDELTIPIVYVSHAMPEIVRLADTMVLMSNGRVEAVGPLDELTSRLDLRPLTGRYEAGAVLEARVEGQDAAFALTELSFAGGRLWVPRLDLPDGAELRLRIRARDVVLAHARPEGTSILNALPCVVKDIGAEEGAEESAQVDLRLDAGGAALWARITRRSLHELGLVPGSEVYALIKAVAIDRYSLGRSAGGGRFFPDAE
ncbi:MAG: molybdenum ABC transporter ATP-binding protein [Proteobacteria bacterium]|nr:molybdenum ABC transporter ATP-binding protein [Pseudomonadota bacterium]